MNSHQPEVMVLTWFRLLVTFWVCHSICINVLGNNVRIYRNFKKNYTSLYESTYFDGLSAMIFKKIRNEISQK